MTIITSYEDWRDERIKENALVECPECNGGGTVPSECPCCGAYDEDSEDCGVCGGEGELPVQELDAFSQRRAIPVRQYLNQLVDELSKLAEWTGRPVEQVISDAGMVPYTRLTEKTETRKTAPNRWESVFLSWASEGVAIAVGDDGQPERRAA